MLSVAEIGYLFLFLPLWVGISIENKLIGLAVAVVLGGVGHFCFQLPALFKSHFSFRWNWDWKHPGSKKVAVLMLPAIVGLSIDQVNAFVDTICATLLIEGSVTALYNSNRIMQFPLALFGIALANVALPSFSSAVTEKNMESFYKTLQTACRMVHFYFAPSVSGAGLPAGSHHSSVVSSWAIQLASNVINGPCALGLQYWAHCLFLCQNLS